MQHKISTKRNHVIILTTLLMLILVVGAPRLNAQWNAVELAYGGSVLDAIQSTDKGMYILTERGGIYTLDKEGTTWIYLCKYDITDPIALHLFSANPRAIYCFRESIYIYDRKLGIWSDLETNKVSALPVKSASVLSDSIIIFTDGQEVFKSTNSGASWEVVLHHAPLGLDWISAITVNANNTVYLTAEDTTYISNDGAASWKKIYNNMKLYINIAYRVSRTIFPVGTTSICKITENGILLYSDIDEEWAGVFNTAGMNARPTIFAIDSSIFCFQRISDEFMIYRSTDWGRSWDSTAIASFAFAFPYIFGSNERNLYVTDYRNCVVSINDGNGSMAYMMTGISELSTRLIAAENRRVHTRSSTLDVHRGSSDSAFLYNITGPWPARDIYLTTEGDVIRLETSIIEKTTDGGEKWIDVGEIQNWDAYFEKTESAIYLAGRYGVYSLNTRNKNIRDLSDSATYRVAVNSQKVVTAVTYSSYILIIREAEEIYKIDARNINELVDDILIFDDNTLLLAAGEELYRGYGEMGTCVRLEEETFDATEKMLLHESGMIFSLSKQGGVQYSSDTGRSWIAIDISSLGAEVRDLAIDDMFLYVCTRGAGVHMMNISSLILDVDEDAYDKRTENILVYPNPASTQLTILGINDCDSRITITLSDIMGRKLYVRNTGNCSPGTINVDSMIPGIYIITIEKNNYPVGSQLVIIE